MKSINKLKSWAFNFKRFWTENLRVGSSIPFYGIITSSTYEVFVSAFFVQ
jgi:hypothetical protein